MNIIATAPQVNTQFFIGNSAASPPVAPPLSVELEVTKWVHARAVGDGASFPNLYCGAGWVLEDQGSGEPTGEGGAINQLKWLRLWAERKPDGGAAVIAAHYARLTCGPLALLVTADAAADTLTFAEPHGLLPGDALRCISGTMPGGITINTDYFVLDLPNDRAVRLSATRGGSLLNITSAGANVVASIGEIELARIYVPATAATAAPAVVPFTGIFPAGTARFTCGSSSPVTLRCTDLAAAAEMQYHIQLAGV